MLTGPFRQNFGNSLNQCLSPIYHSPNFCSSQNVPDNVPTSFVRYRKINGTYNNSRRKKATFGAWSSRIAAARFLPQSMSVTKNDRKASLAELKAK